ncbi:MAG: hypothetical protein ABJQ90_10830, partial [Parasphingorhabdus sp.]
EDHAPLDEGEVSLGGVEKGEAGVAAPAGSPPTAAAWPPTAAPIYAVRVVEGETPLLGAVRRAVYWLAVCGRRKKKGCLAVWRRRKKKGCLAVRLFQRRRGLFAKSCLSVGLSAKS